MKKNKFSKSQFVVNNQSGFDFDTALRLWKTKYEDDIRDFEKEVITHPGLQDLNDFVKEVWDKIEPFTVKDALQVENLEQRRTYFDAIGINKIFLQMNPKLLDKQVVKKKRTRWDDKNDPYDYEFEDVYELYELDGEKLFGKDRWGNPAQSVFAVRCWCTTTGREYWLYVPMNAALDISWRNQFTIKEEKPDAIRAIAWTILLDVKNPQRIYRQGDIIVVKTDGEPEVGHQYHLDKKSYLRLMYSET